MQISHFGHACVLVETSNARVLIDPGTLSADFEHLRGLDAVLITHQHFDHIDSRRLPALLQANPEASLIHDAGSERTLAELGLHGRIVTPGEVIKLGASRWQVTGGQHAVIHPNIEAIHNIGYLLNDGEFYHPGDSFFIPPHKIDVLGLPAAAPWMQLADAVDFWHMIKPRVALPIHEAILANPAMTYDMFRTLAPAESELRVATVGSAITI